ncbi:histidine-phosphotransfer domain, HPT domain-containing protein [Gonapodya prolifera JEL478]|uniref:Histidine-phosphotransfer domain, HPT domain-containing protein n=1 Tax=Gonapodya prolifera (strain JEL478) TaxID=1344416 RepID=A0A139A038_GONPJ|nr:histidine-phosphotransfer domain, HPT domain-containing protein [Gonapodya prolifera JEL478]|eukprot:KXS10146.1 histidine-phosphotransfer domain, HPT domain-containing protein [Gonapodya prolifera JEL478]
MPSKDSPSPSERKPTTSPPPPPPPGRESPPPRVPADDDRFSPDAIRVNADIIDEETIEQLLDMDEDEDREFTRSLVVNYFDQALTTFKEIESDLTRKDLESVGKLGHFLKGSSGALGVIKVRTSCEELQHLGKLRYREKPVSVDEALRLAGSTLKRARDEFEEARKELSRVFEVD